MLIYPTSLSILHMYIYICDVSILIYSFFYVVFVVYSARWIFIQDQLYLLVYNNRNIRPVAKELSVVFRLRKFKIFSDISDHLMLRTCYVDRTTNNTKYVYQNNIQFLYIDLFTCYFIMVACVLVESGVWCASLLFFYRFIYLFL